MWKTQAPGPAWGSAAWPQAQLTHWHSGRPWAATEGKRMGLGPGSRSPWILAKLLVMMARPPRWRGSRAACSRLEPSP